MIHLLDTLNAMYLTHYARTSNVSDYLYSVNAYVEQRAAVVRAFEVQYAHSPIDLRTAIQEDFKTFMHLGQH